MGSQVLLLAFLLFLSAFSSSAETALTSLSRLRILHLIKHGRSQRQAKALEHLLTEPNDFITSLLVLNNLVNVGAATLMTLLIVGVLPENISSAASGAISTFLMTALLLVFGEVTPKTVGKNRSEAVALRVVVPVWQLCRILRPVVRALRAAAGGVLRPFGEELLQREAPHIEREELIVLVDTGRELGTISHQDAEMIKRILTLSETTAEDVMVSRMDMQAIEVNTPIPEVLNFVISDGHSRYPVYEQTQDNMIGILYVKDMLGYLAQGGPRWTSLREALRPVYYAPTTKPINALLREFQRERVHIAVVVDEYGGVSGIVTMEDVLEEIVGEIEDEYDRRRSRQLIRKLSLTEALVDGDAEVRRINRTLGLDLPEDEAVTIAGLILERLGDIPEPGTKVRLGRSELTVEQATEREITAVRISVLPVEK